MKTRSSLDHGLADYTRKLWIVSPRSFRNVSKIPVFILTVLLFFTGCRESIIHNLSESDANRIITRLNDIAIDAERERQADGRWSIRVDSDNAAPAIKLISEARLIREARPEPEAKSSMIASREEQRFQFERSLSREVESTLLTMEGVVEARVHLNLPPIDPLFGGAVAAKGIGGSGSVLIVADGAMSIPDDSIAKLVAGAAGIEQKNVSVLVSHTAARDSDEKSKQVESILSSPRAPSAPTELAAPSSRKLFWEAGLSLIVAIIGFFLIYRARKAVQVPQLRRAI